jgi:hypothetical protein
MSCYLVKGMGWRYDFILKGKRYASKWYDTEVKARRAEARRKEEILSPAPQEITPTDMDFLELINRRLDHVKAYSSESQYKDYWYMARRWSQEWKELKCEAISSARERGFLPQKPEGL